MLKSAVTATVTGVHSPALRPSDFAPAHPVERRKDSPVVALVTEDTRAVWWDMPCRGK